MSRIFYCPFGQVSKSTVNNFRTVRTVRTFRSGAPSWDNQQQRHVLNLIERLRFVVTMSPPRISIFTLLYFLVPWRMERYNYHTVSSGLFGITSYLQKSRFQFHPFKASCVPEKSFIIFWIANKLTLIADSQQAVRSNQHRRWYVIMIGLVLIRVHCRGGAILLRAALSWFLPYMSGTQLSCVSFGIHIRETL